MSILAISLLGMPGAGKGTIAAGIAEKTSYVHVSTGNLLRDAISAKTAIGREAESYMSRGDLVPDEMVLSMVVERINGDEASSRYMFDGFPRTLAQAHLLQECLKEHDAVLSFVFLLEVSTEVSLSRLGGRRICKNCGANFHVRNIPPRNEGVCDHCQGELYQRSDDTEKTIMNRIAVFNEQSEGLFSYYEDQGVLVRVDASRPWQEVLDEIINTLYKTEHRGV